MKYARVVLCDANGKDLQSKDVAGTGVLLPATEGAVCLKLFSGKYLVDTNEVKDSA